MSAERRTPTPALRIPIHLPVQMAINGLLSAETALNISMGGMFIRTTHYVRPGSELQIEFSLSPHEKTTASGKVVWASEGMPGNELSFARGLGIQFTYLPQAAKNQLSRLSNAYRTFP